MWARKCGTQSHLKVTNSFGLTSSVRSLLSAVSSTGLRPRQYRWWTRHMELCQAQRLCDAHVLQWLRSTARKERGPHRPSGYRWRPRRVITAIMATSSLGRIWLTAPSAWILSRLSWRPFQRQYAGEVQKSIWPAAVSRCTMKSDSILCGLRISATGTCLTLGRPII